MTCFEFTPTQKHFIYAEWPASEGQNLGKSIGQIRITFSQVTERNYLFK